jgi:glycosyltransferase involved in cell wall biosynthesis
VATLLKEISIIIPLWNSPIIHRTIDSIKQQDFDLTRVEVIVVGRDNPNLVKEDDLVRFIKSDAPVSGARNIGINAAKGNILAFLDSDCIASKQWLKRLVAQHEKGYPIVGGGIAVKGQNYMATCYNITTFHEFLNTSPQGKRKYLPTINMSITREVVDTVGLLEDKLKRAEDLEWSTRMTRCGYDIIFEPSAYVFHIPETSLRRIWTKWVSTGYYSREVRKQFPDILRNSLLLKSQYLILALSFFISTATAGRIYLKNKGLLRYFHTFPVVFVTKLAWCLGAAYNAGAHWLGRFILPKGKLVT